MLEGGGEEGGGGGEEAVGGVSGGKTKDGNVDSELFNKLTTGATGGDHLRAANGNGPEGAFAGGYGLYYCRSFGAYGQAVGCVLDVTA